METIKTILHSINNKRKKETMERSYKDFAL